MSELSGLRGIGLPQSFELPKVKPQGSGFQNFLEQAIQRVESARADAEQSTHSFLTEGNGELHSVALSVQRAELELELALQVRNKVVQAYQEIMRMQI